MALSRRIQSIEASKTAALTVMIAERRRKGQEVIDLAVGEPVYDAPLPVIRSTTEALNAGETRYGAVAGLPALRSGIAAEFDGLGPENILVTNGSKQALYTLFQVVCDPGDEVIVPLPCWVSFAHQIRLAGAVPVFVNTRDHQLDCEAIERAVTRKTAAILINSPNNPTGAVYPMADLEAIAGIARRHGLVIVSDEAYDRFVYEGREHASVFAVKEVRDRTVVTRSFSKSYSMTGFRVGYAVGPPAIIAAMMKLQSHLTGNVCTFAQFGAVAALALNPDRLARMRAELDENREIAWAYASKMFDCIRPQGAFYIFPEISRCLKPGQTAEQFAASLLETAGVAVVPGGAFGAENHIRISYAVPRSRLISGLERIGEAL